jgi:hypothetical protein
MLSGFVTSAGVPDTSTIPSPHAKHRNTTQVTASHFFMNAPQVAPALAGVGTSCPPDT